jgi:hypothetical protein
LPYCRFYSSKFLWAKVFKNVKTETAIFRHFLNYSIVHQELTRIEIKPDGAH